MRRSVLVNAALLALGLVTLALVWATREAPTTGETRARADKLLPRWQRDAVTRITIERGARRLQLETSGAENDAGTDRDAAFTISSPWNEPADVGTVRSLLGSLDLASPLRPAADVSRAQAGLEKPALKLEFTSPARVDRLLVGGPAPSPSGAHYVEVRSGDEAPKFFTISAGLLRELDLPFEKFREPLFLSYGASEIGALELGPRNRTLRITLAENGEHLLKADERDQLADRDAVDALLTALSRLSTDQFVDTAQARALLPADAVHLRVEPRAKGRRAVELAIGGSCPDAPERALLLREAGDSGARAGCVPRELVTGFQVGAAELRLERPFSARADEVEELSIRQGASKLELARKDAAFILRAPNTGEVALDAGNQRITEIVRARGERAPGKSLAELGLEPPAGEVTIQVAGTKQAARPVQRVSIGRARAGGSLCLRRERDQVVLCVDAETARSFKADATLLKGLSVLTFAASELTSLAIEGEGRSERLSRSSEGRYELRAPSGFQHDGALVADLVQTLGGLRAERWAADANDGSFGLEKPRLQLTLELGGGANGEGKRRTLKIGGPARGGSYAQLDGDPAVFVLPRSELAALEVSLINRSLCAVGPDSLAQVELRAGTRRLLLRRSGDRWQSDPESRPERIAELLEAVTSLRAERALHTGPPRPEQGLSKPSLSVTFTETSGKLHRLRFGNRDVLADTAIFYARLDDLDATFVVAEGAVSGLRDF